MWNNMFVVKLALLEKILRPVLVYVFLVAALRVFGKRELAQLNPFDLVVLLSLSNTVQNAIIGEDNSLLGGLIGALSLLLVNYMVVRYLFKHRRLDQILEGEPTDLIVNGSVVEKNLAKELLTRAELETVAHRQGFGSVDEIEKCTLEPGGVFYIQSKKPDLEETRHQLVMERLDQLNRRLDEFNMANNS
jgi:uncharacterized membrane protein YcaP (DUF421 family)